MDTVRVELLLHGISDVDLDYDTCKSLLHVLAQRLRSLPSPTCDQNCLTSSWMDVPTISAQSCHTRMIPPFARDMLRLFHLQALLIIARNGLHRGHVYMCPVTWCGLLLGSFELQFLDESQIWWSSSGSGTEARHAQSLININENYSNCLISGTSSGHRRPSRVNPARSLQSVA